MLTKSARRRNAADDLPIDPAVVFMDLSIFFEVFATLRQ
jgi:hypothetical protein